MAIEKFEKQSWEKFPIWGSILNVQDASETIVLGSSFVIAMDKDGREMDEVVLDQSTMVLGNDPDGSYTDNMLGIKVQKGSKLESPYYITFKMITNAGNQWEVDVKMVVKDIPTVIRTSTTTTTV